MIKAKIVIFFAWTMLCAFALTTSDVQAQDEELGQLDEVAESIDSPDDEQTGNLDLSEMIDASRSKRHPYLFAVSGSAYHMIPINILKEEVYDINDLTSAGFGFSVGGKIFILDGLALTVDYRRAKIGFVDDKPGQMAPINAMLIDGGPRLTPDGGIKMDHVAIGLTSYLGDKMMPESRFNFYLNSQLLFSDWSVTDDGRVGSILNYENELLEGSDMGIGLGFGTEYALSSKIQLDTSLVWNFVLTGDEVRFDGFDSLNHSQYWTNTHWWGLSLGLVIGL